LKPLTTVLLTAIVVVAVATVAYDVFISEPSLDYRLTILHNNSPESFLFNPGPGLEDFGGVARFAEAVERERHAGYSRQSRTDDKTRAGQVLLSSGNIFLPSKEFRAGRELGEFYDAQAIDLMRYDAIALGAHEFDFGPDDLAEVISQVSESRAPFLSANLDFSDEPLLQNLVEEGRIRKSVVVEKNGESIGIVGATTPELRVVSSPENVRILDVVAREVQAEVDLLEASGVNKIILISHMQDIKADIALVSDLQGVDVVIAGGSDELLANEGDLLIPGDDDVFGPYPLMANDREGLPIPLISTLGHYKYLGKLVVEFDSKGRALNVDPGSSGPIRIALGDKRMQKRVIDPQRAALNELRKPIGDTEVALDGRRSSVRYRETNLGNLMADHILWQAKQLAPTYGAPIPDVAIQNGGGIRNDGVLAPGSVNLADIIDIAPYVNDLTVVHEVDRVTFKTVLENAVSRAAVGDSELGTGRFAQISGFSFVWSVSGNAQSLGSDCEMIVEGARIREVVLDNGEAIVSRGRVITGTSLNVATPDFTAFGGDQYCFGNAKVTQLGPEYNLSLENYIKESEGLNKLITASEYPEGGVGRIRQLP
jgi:5'-nucleotidase